VTSEPPVLARAVFKLLGVEMKVPSLIGEGIDRPRLDFKNLDGSTDI
jgi:hypothetical protein